MYHVNSFLREEPCQTQIIMFGMGMKCCFFHAEEENRRPPFCPFQQVHSEMVLVAGDASFVAESFQRLGCFERSTLCLSFPHSLQPGQPRIVNLNVEKCYLRAQKETRIRGKQNS